MTDQAVGEFESVWEAAGARVAETVDGASAVVVVGHDPIATAAVALGIARSQATHRRVAVGDLIGDVRPLRELVTDDDPHGLTDLFLYGVSLNKIARQIDQIGNLHVLPSGSDQVVQPDILRNDRWQRIAASFRDTGALLIVAAAAAVPGVDALIAMFDGVVLVGGAESPLPNAVVFAEVATAARRSPQRAAANVPAVAVSAPGSRRARWIIPLVALAATAAVVAVVARPYFGRSQAPAPTLRRDSAAASDSFVASPSVPDSATAAAVANPADSVVASAYAVQVAMNDTENGAAARLRAGGAHFPVGTYAIVTRGNDGGTWYKVVTGAYTDQAHAESLLAFIRRRGVVPEGWGAVVRAPVALQLATAPSRTEAAALIADFQSRGIPVYGLLQRDGSVRIYTGAFESADEAALAQATLKNSKNIDATLVYRVGRAY